MKKIKKFEIDTSLMPNTATVRNFLITGDIGAKFTIIIVQEGTIKYYDFKTNSFELGHNNIDNNLEVTMSNTSYRSHITFPSGGGTYFVKLLVGDNTQIDKLNNKYTMVRKIEKQSAVPIVTFSPATANASNYATFPTTTSTGGSGDTDSFTINWDITNASTDSHGFGLRIPGGVDQEVSSNSFYFTTTDTVDGAVAPTDINEGLKVTVDDLTDIAVGMYISAVGSGSLSGTPYITEIDTSTKTLTLTTAQTFADGITLTFRANGLSAIYEAIGLRIVAADESNVFALTPTTLTKTIRAGSSGTTINLNGTYGIAGGNHVKITGLGIDNSSSNAVTSVTASSSAGSIVVQNSQDDLTTNSTITFIGTHQVINFTGDFIITSYPTANKNIYYNIDDIITVGAAS
tara:strand:+ start:3020 stop:4228 length:1209 start_codon:yes stop_codon:yes gene_type:complete